MADLDPSTSLLLNLFLKYIVDPVGKKIAAFIKEHNLLQKFLPYIIWFGSLLAILVVAIVFLPGELRGPKHPGSSQSQAEKKSDSDETKDNQDNHDSQKRQYLTGKSEQDSNGNERGDQTQNRPDDSTQTQPGQTTEPESVFRLGRDYYFGSDKIMQNKTAAYGYFLEAAQKGHAEAQFFLGTMNLMGDTKTKTQSFGEAEKWYKQSAVLDYPDANYVLGLMYKNGWTKAHSIDVSKALEYFQKADHLENPYAQYEIGIFYYEREKFALSETFLKKSAKNGFSPAQYLLALMYLEGRPGIDKDEEQGIELLFQAAGNGHSRASRKCMEYFSKSGVNGNANYLAAKECLNATKNNQANRNQKIMPIILAQYGNYFQ